MYYQVEPSQPNRESGASWKDKYSRLTEEIQVDHYSPQELLGHSDVGTTMIYTHTVKSVTIKEAKSPLDF